MTTPYFSVIIPTLNEEEALPRLLKNLVEQTYRQFDVTVIDGSSTDDTQSIVHKFKAGYPLTLITTDVRNASYQRNLGAKQSHAKVLIFIDADTQIPKNYLEKMYQAFETKRPHFLTTYLKVDSRKAADQWFPAFTNLIFEISRMVKIPAVYGAMMAIKRTVFEDIGGFDEQCTFGEDSQLFQTAIDYNYKFLVLSSPRYTFSLRRFRAEGTLDTINQYLRLNLAAALNGYHGFRPDYAMGGHAHQLKKNPPQFTRRFDRLFKQLRHIPNGQSAKFREFMNRLFVSKE